MTATFTPAPVRKTIRVAVKPQRAFDVFTGGMHRWWPLDHSLLQGLSRKDVVMEARVGGRWYECATDGTECQWGKVLAWEPPNRVLLAWQVDGTWAFNPDFLTEVEIRFMPDGDGTRVELEHRNIERYGELADATRKSLDSDAGWMLGLARFAEVAAD